jgi:hypothetical protein
VGITFQCRPWELGFSLLPTACMITGPFYPILLRTSFTISLSTLSLISLSKQHHLPVDTSLQDITLSFQESGCDVINIKQMTPKCPSPEGSIITISLPCSSDFGMLSGVTANLHSYWSVPPSKHTKPRQCYISQHFRHICVHWKQP